MSSYASPEHLAAAHDGIHRAVDVGLVREYPRVEGELDRVLVDHTDGVVGTGRLDDGVEGVALLVVADGRVALDDLLDLVGALRELDLRLHVALVRLDADLHRLDLR